MSASSTAEPDHKAKARSRVTNGSALLAGVDGRSTWVRRCRDVLNAHITDLGGDDLISEAERSICRRVAVLTVELERLEWLMAQRERPAADAIALYTTTANSLRRLLESIGLQRRARDVTSLGQILREGHRQHG